MDFRNPVSHLEEFCRKGKFERPYYKYLNGEEAWAKCTEFLYQVTGLGLTAIGSGNSKRSAKQNAAKKLLELLNPEGFSKDIIDNSWKHVELVKEELCTDEWGVDANFSQLLDQYCCKHKMPCPKYEVVSREDLQHLTIFKMKCCVVYAKIQKLYTLGEGRSQREGRRMAAKQMFLYLRKLLEPLNPGESSKENTPVPPKVEQFDKEELSPDNSNIETCFILLLSHYCSKHKIHNPIYDIVSREGLQYFTMFRVRCSLLFSIDGMLVTEGEGRTKKGAKRMAAKQMYLYVKDKKPNFHFT